MGIKFVIIVKIFEYFSEIEQIRVILTHLKLWATVHSKKQLEVRSIFIYLIQWFKG